ncbi:MAG: pitrilysin family protein, partial [Cyanobacteria bacterium]|nr:pitrilysin family protein [Cyanobacteriota bacterium]
MTSKPGASHPAAMDSAAISRVGPASSPGSLGGPRARSVLPGGCPLWVVQRPGPEIVSAKLWIRGGSSSDPGGQRGSQQLLAGLLSRGCGDYSGEALADQVEGLGAGLRCEASEDGLLISLKCAAADANQLLPLLLTLVQKPWLLNDQIDLERQLNLQALQRHREDPFQLAHDRLRQQLYGDGPYGHDPLGVEAELAAIGRDSLSQQATRLGRQGAVLVLAGQPPANLEELLTRESGPGGWPTQAPLANPTWAPTHQPGRPCQRLASNEEDTEQLVLMLGAATVPLGHRQGLALRLLHCHLGVGMSSRLFVTMREEHGLAYDVGVHHPARLGAAPFVFHLSSSAERAFEATNELLNEWQRLLAQPLTGDELALARAKFRGQEAMGRQT